MIILGSKDTSIKEFFNSEKTFAPYFQSLHLQGDALTTV